MPCFALKIWRYAESPYLCNVFFIVLDLRLTKVGVQRYSFFYARTSGSYIRSARTCPASTAKTGAKVPRASHRYPLSSSPYEYASGASLPNLSPDA